MAQRRALGFPGAQAQFNELQPAWSGWRTHSTGIAFGAVISLLGCGVLVRELLIEETPVTVELASNGRSKKGRIVLVRSLVEAALWLLGLEFDSPAGDFWEIENPPADWGNKWDMGVAV